MTGARKIDGTSCTIAISPAAAAPPRSYAKTSSAIHWPYSARTTARYAASSRLSERFRATWAMTSPIVGQG